jgi:hypothetical protein
LNFRICGGWLLLAGFLVTVPATAGGISYTCNSNIGTSTCQYLNSTLSGLYAGVFTNANAQIYIQYGSTGLGESQQYYNSTTYNNYLSALTSHSSSDATDVAALLSLQGGEPSIFGTGDVYVTSALAAALGLSGGTGVAQNLSACTLNPSSSNPTCYNGIITISNGQSYYYRTGQQTSGEYDIYSVIEHETDEILGTSSCIVTVSSAPSDGCGTNGLSPADLFRYSAANTRSFISQGNGTTAYFSVNSGATPIAYYNNSPNGADYGDWSSSCAHIQDAYGCSGLSMDITNDGRVEIPVLDAVGYTLVTTPEPATSGLFVLGIAGLVQLRRRRRAYRKSASTSPSML